MKGPALVSRRALPDRKRTLDLALGGVATVLLAPVMALVAVAILLSDGWPVLYRQLRVGRDGAPFRIVKFRTMSGSESREDLAVEHRSRITPLGRRLRRLKLDELPQLFNVLAGHMSLVGPRPELQRYVEGYPPEFACVLSVRPGLTDLASVVFSDEERILQAVSDPVGYYVQSVLPRKLELQRAYVRRASLALDVRILVATAASVFGLRQVALRLCGLAPEAT